MHIFLALSLLLAANPRPAQAASPAAQPRSVVIYPLLPLGTETEVADRLEALVYVEMQSLGTLTVVPRGEALAAERAQVARGSRCAGTPECLAAFGRAVGADQVFYSTVAGLGQSYVLDAKLVDTAEPRVLARKSVVLQGDQAVLISGVRQLAVQVVAPEHYVGSLELHVDQDGTQVIVDGLPIGSTPLPTLRQLVPGKHALRLVKPGFPELDRFVEIRYGETTQLEVELVTGKLRSREPAGSPTASAAAPAVATAIGSSLDLRWPLGLGGLVTGGLLLAAGVASGAQLLLPWLAATGYTRTTEQGRVVVTDRDAYLAEVQRYRSAVGWWWLGVGLTSTSGLLLPVGAAVLGWALLDPVAEEDRR